MQVAVGPAVVESSSLFKVAARMVVAFLLAVVVLFVVGAVAFNRDHTVEVQCGGPTASMPLTDRGLDVAGKLGDSIHDLTTEAKQPWQVVRTVFGMFRTIRLWLDNFRSHGNNRPEGSAVAGWRTRTRDAQEKALASCCPSPTGDPGNPSPAPPPAVEPFDPKSAALIPGLTGAPLAADALARAGFPAAEIPMGVAVAKYESSFNPVPPNPPTVRGGTMRGMWQINDGVHRMVGDWRNPYDNARMAYTVWSDARSWQPWSTAAVAARHVGEFRQYGQGSAPQAPAAVGAAPSPACPQLTGDLTGNITLTATLNPAGAGNWQGAVHDGNYWYVAHATPGDWSQVFHRLNAAGLEVDQMAAVGFAHATSFAVVGSTVYATNRRGQVAAFPYQPGATVTSGTPTGWSGFISKDPTGPNVVIRNGDHYRAYNAATRQPVGVPVRTDPGARQGFSISGTTVYVLTGLTNQPARVDSYNIRTGQLSGSRDITALGESEAGSHREPEGLYGDMVGVKVNTGTNRRLLIYRLDGATGAVGDFAFAQFRNPRTPEQAIAWMRSRGPITPDRCLAYVRGAYGWPTSIHGTNAKDRWATTPAQYRHPGDWDAPRGALMVWNIRTGHPGHIAISLGLGQIISTDVPRNGVIGVRPTSYFANYGDYLGWIPPYFDQQTTIGAKA